MSVNNQVIASERTALASSLYIEVVTETYPPEINGVAHTISMLINGLRKSRHHVEVVRPRQITDQRLNQNQSNHSDFLVKSLPIPLYRELRVGMPAQGRLIKRWEQRRPDIVHIATEGPLGWSALKAASKLGIPITSDFRTNFHAYSSLYRIGFLEPLIMAYLKHFHNATDCTMVPTDNLKTELEHIGLLNLQVIPRGVDTHQFSETLRSHQLRASWGVKPTDVVLLSVGRLAIEKNLELLIRSYEQARNIDSSIKLIVVGDGPMRDSLQKKCPEAIFVGKKSGEDLAEHYASADIFIFPSLTETFGNVTIEAMASGLAVIAYKHAAAGQLIESGRNGITIEPGNESEFIQAVTSTALNKSLIHRLGCSAITTAKEHSWLEIVRRTEKIWHELINDKSNPIACHDKFIIST